MRPITTRAAENGMRISLYICGLVLATALGVQMPEASFLVWIGSLLMPFFLYRMLRRSQLEAGGTLRLSELWAEGIMSFFLGSLLPAVLVYVALRFAAPNFIYNTLVSTQAQCLAVGTPEALQLSQMFESILKQKLVPTPLDVVSQLLSFNVIAGTTLSLLAAVFARFAGSKPVAKPM